MLLESMGLRRLLLKYCGPYHSQLLKLDSRRRFCVYCRCPKQMESTFWHFLLTH